MVPVQSAIFTLASCLGGCRMHLFTPALPSLESSRVTRYFLQIFVAAICLASLPGLAGAQANVQGQWQTLPNPMPINPVHAALLHNGKVLVVSGSGNLPSNTNFQAGVFDPQTNTVTTQPVGWDMFCNGMVVLPDGRALINGGADSDEAFHGGMRRGVFHFLTGAFTQVHETGPGRLCSTVAKLD